MSKISSTTLFHFMQKKEWLVEILRELKMTPRYVLEKYPLTKEKYLILMKCFCDIRLSSISDHINTYGKYGIGLTKDFAFKNHISPVQYFHEVSHPMFALLSVDFKEKEDFAFLISFFKYMYSNDKSINYYDEREWRYVNKKGIEVSNKTDIEIETIKSNLNSNINTVIELNFSDIQYLFVENNNDLIYIIDEIEKMKFNRIDKNILISKIITIDQINNDF